MDQKQTMMMMNGKRIVGCLVFAAAAFFAGAQNLPVYVRALSDRGIEVSMDPTVVRASMGYPPSNQVAGYRLCLFSDNGQSARGAAKGALQMLSTVAPGVRGQMIYTNPFFRVYAGHCLTKTEAVMLLGRLKYSFPKAYIVSYSGSVNEFLNVTAALAADTTSVGQ